MQHTGIRLLLPSLQPLATLGFGRVENSWKRELPACRKATSGRLKQSEQILQAAPGGRLPYTSVLLAGMLDFVTWANAHLVSCWVQRLLARHHRF